MPADRQAGPGDCGTAVDPAAAEQVSRQPGLAVGRGPVAAVRAGGARGEGEQTLIAGLNPGNRRADPFDDPGAFVAEHAGQWERQSATGDTEIGVAEAG